MRAHEFPAKLSHEMGVVSAGQGAKPLVVKVGAAYLDVVSVHWDAEREEFVIALTDTEDTDALRRYSAARGRAGQ